MNRRTVGAIGLSALAIAVAFPRADAQPSNDIVGTWTLVSTTNEKNGQKLFPYGPKAKGSFSLDGKRFSLIVVRPSFEVQVQRPCERHPRGEPGNCAGKYRIFRHVLDR